MSARPVRVHQDHPLEMLREYLEYKTQGEFAHAFGVSRARYCRWIAGQKIPVFIDKFIYFLSTLIEKGVSKQKIRDTIEALPPRNWVVIKPDNKKKSRKKKARR